MSRSTCRGCKQAFFKDEPWKTLCLSCWQRGKNSTAATVAEQSNRIGELMQQNDALRQQLANVRRLIELGRNSALTPERLATLIRLAHPDRHGGSVASNEATAWLLSLRGKV